MGYWEAGTWILQRCRTRFRSAVALSLAVKILSLVLLAPLAAMILRFCLTRWGRASVGNFEIASFFLSPVGLTALIGVGVIYLATLYLELTGLVRLLVNDELHWWESFKSSTKLFHRLVHLGLRLLVLCLVLAVPFLAGIGSMYWLFWSGKDLNGLIILKPPEFWWGVGLAGTIAVIYVVLAVQLLLRRMHAISIVTLESGVSVSDALRSSIQRSEGTLWRCTATIALWALIQFSLSAVIFGITQFVLQTTLLRSHASLTVSVLFTGTALLIHLLVATILNVVANVTFAGVILVLYRQVSSGDSLRDHKSEPRIDNRVLPGWVVGAALVVLAAITVSSCIYAIRDLKLEEDLEITAHRAGAASAPENTVAALKQAIGDRADWAEIDVQLTSDQALVIMHDIDLARVGGGNRRVDEATLAEIQALDVGSSVGQQFAGERIPTLVEILAAAGDKIRLNIELKPHSVQDGQLLTRRVIEEIQRTGIVDQCRLCSQSYESLQLARQIEPRLELGYIAGAAVGKPEDLDIDFLMMKSSLATPKFVERARLRKIRVHAWTVNDPAEVPALLDAGVANLITDDPVRIRTRLDEIRALSTVDRLLLRARHAIAQ